MVEELCEIEGRLRNLCEVDELKWMGYVQVSVTQYMVLYGVDKN
jgi:hypothetical protein